MRNETTGHQRFLTGDAIVGKEADDYFTRLAQQIEADTDPSPQVVLTGAAPNGRTIFIIEAAALSPDGRLVRRGFLWLAMTGDFTLVPSRIHDGVVAPGMVLGGTQVALSTSSAADALVRAQRHMGRPA